MTDELGPYSKWLVAVATAAKERPYLATRELGDGMMLVHYCVGCGAEELFGDVTHDQACRFLALNAALDAEPKE